MSDREEYYERNSSQNGIPLIENELQSVRWQQIAEKPEPFSHLSVYGYDSRNEYLYNLGALHAPALFSLLYTRRLRNPFPAVYAQLFKLVIAAAVYRHSFVSTMIYSSVSKISDIFSSIFLEVLDILVIVRKCFRCKQRCGSTICPKKELQR